MDEGWIVKVDGRPITGLRPPVCATQRLEKTVIFPVEQLAIATAMALRGLLNGVDPPHTVEVLPLREPGRLLRLRNKLFGRGL
jgi:hypothetical protein